MMKQDKYDMIVVGTGFASTFFLSRYLSKAPSSVKVLVLERGHLYPHSERLKERRRESTPYQKLNELSHDTFINENPEKHWEFQAAFGGGSNCWYGCTPRFMPSDFKMKSLYGIASDWPLQYEELEPYYDQVEHSMSISGPDDTPYPRKGSYPQPPHAFNTVDKILKSTYGNLYVSQPTARAKVPVNGRGSCCVSAECSVCPVNAKFTIENSGMGVFEDERVELVYGAKVFAMELQQNAVRKLSYIRDGKERSATADIFALGANAIFNAHILLNSGDASPLTGKGLGEQYGLGARVYLKNMSNVGGGTWVSGNGYMLYDGDHRKNFAACLMESNNAPFLRLEKGKWRDVANFRMIFEDLPDERNYVATTSDLMMPKVHFEGPSAYTLRAVENMKKKLPEILASLPVENIEYSKPYATEAHIMGTARMSQKASDGVVDKHLIHHKYRNLFVLGSSAFTTFSPANPTLTLSALSLYAADNSF
ncbi:GMC oxidoreductase [Pontibacter toksunensis]|uniref:GMC oxidoreductase n=1 Tax=Pontibacter toksunensis TaxID=1332631 RepID=A0ABW6BTT1_9BACT